MGAKKRLSIPDTSRGDDKSSGKETEGQGKIPVVIGLDVSTTCTGVCVLHAQTGQLIKLYPIKFTSTKIDDFWDKVSLLKTALLTNIEPDWDIRSVAVEENAKRFTPGFSSADTILTLAKFNGIACHVFFESFNIKPHYINVRSARSKLGIKIDQTDKTQTTKQKVLRKVVELNPNFPWIYREVKGEKQLVKINEDLGDSWVIAAAARKLFPAIIK
jgi:hypothetical protein